MSKCLQCGKCCEEVFFVIDSAYTESGLDHMNWAEYHGFNILFCKNAKGKDFWGIKIKAQCRHLQDINGTTICTIHSFRPKMCKSYDGADEFPECGYNK